MKPFFKFFPVVTSSENNLLGLDKVIKEMMGNPMFNSTETR